MRRTAVVIVAWTCLFFCCEAFPDYYSRGEACPEDTLCRPVRQCPEAVLAVTSGGPRPRRCGFRGFDELVCCAEEQPSGRPSAAQQRPRPSPSSAPQRAPAHAPAHAPTPGLNALGARPTRSPTRVPSGSSPSAEACQRYRADVKDELTNAIDFKINGGEYADEGEFPYMVAIGYAAPRRTNLTWNCAGSLISERYVLTAAHCITDTEAQNLRPVALRVGEVRVESGPRRASDYGVAGVVRHPGHAAQLRYNDLALLRADRAVALAPSAARPVCLPAPGARLEAAPGAMLLAAGWGAVDAAGFVGSPDLKKVQLRVVDLKECARRLNSQSALPRGLDDGMLCASGKNGEDTCRGDSGGPLVVRRNGEDTLVGVTSFGGNPCGGLRPGVYASTATALDWIESVVWP